MGDRPRTLVLCCVGADAAPLQPAFDVLSMRGFAIVVVDGANVRPSTLAEHALRHEGEALYVFAVSPESSATALAPLQAILRAVCIPPELVSTLAIDWRDPMALAEHVQSLDSRRAAQPTAAAPSVDPPGRRTVVATTPPPTVASVDRPSTGPQRTTLPPQKRITGSYRAVPKAPERATGARVPASAAPTPSRTRTVRPDAPSAEVTPRAPVESTAVGPFPAPQSITQSPIADAPIAAAPIATPPAALVAPEPACSTSGVSITRPNRVRLVTAALKPLAAIGASMSTRALRWVAQSRTRVLAVAGVAMTAIAISVVAAWPEEVSEPRADTDDLAPRVVSAAVVPTAPAVAGTPLSAAESDEPDVAIEVVAEPTTKQDVEPAADPVAIVVPKPVVSPARIRLGNHAGIVFAPTSAPKQKYRAAKKMCDDMNAGETSGWRMPTLSELHILAVAHVIERGVYWSDTEADAFGERALVWSEKRTAAMPITKAWGGARSLCIRDEPAGP